MAREGTEGIPPYMGGDSIGGWLLKGRSRSQHADYDGNQGEVSPHPTNVGEFAPVVIKKLTNILFIAGSAH